MSDLDALIAKVEGLTGADREVDGLIEQSLGIMPSDAYWSKNNVYGEVVARWVSGHYGAYKYHDPAELTASLDAIVKLVEAKLPGSHWRVEKTCERPALSFRTHQFTGYCGDWGKPSRAEGPTPAIALCLALLRALAQEEGKP